MTIKLYNTMKRRKVKFEPTEKKKLKMFVCGPTVYDSMHLGHARVFIFYDLLSKFFEINNYKINFVINLTDLDPKIFEKAKNDKVKYNVISEKYTKEFLRDIDLLNINSKITFAKASDYVDEAINQINGLIANKFAYKSSGKVFYNTLKFLDYGKLSNQTSAEIKLRRLEIDPDKTSQSDFPLWVPSEENEPVWDTKFGNGKPGWHIEDTAISIKLLGERYDIHGGAKELIFPHHEAEIAQAEGFTGKKPFVKYWIHTGLLKINGKKMSKSLKNSIKVSDLLKQYESNVIKLYFCSYKYRKDMNFNTEEINEIKKTFRIIKNAVKKLNSINNSRYNTTKKEEGNDWSDFKRCFYEYLADDMDTPNAVNELKEFSGWVNNSNNKLLNNEIKQVFFTMCWSLGLIFEKGFIPLKN